MVELRKYVDPRGHCPVDAWLARLRDGRGRSRVGVRITRLALGAEGDWKSVGEGVRELRVDEGPGYRIYYAWDGPRIVVLLLGGDKSSQARDIDRAKKYWRSYGTRK